MSKIGEGQPLVLDEESDFSEYEEDFSESEAEYSENEEDFTYSPIRLNDFLSHCFGRRIYPWWRRVQESHAERRKICGYSGSPKRSCTCFCGLITLLIVIFEVAAILANVFALMWSPDEETTMTIFKVRVAHYLAILMSIFGFFAEIELNIFLEYFKILKNWLARAIWIFIIGVLTLPQDNSENPRHQIQFQIACYLIGLAMLEFVLGVLLGVAGFLRRFRRNRGISAHNKDWQLPEHKRRVPADVVT